MGYCTFSYNLTVACHIRYRSPKHEREHHAKLDEPHDMYTVNNKSDIHEPQLREFIELCLCAFDDKRYILDDGVHTLAYGHISINSSQLRLVYIAFVVNRVHIV